jgi:two-component system, sensor histidine kinase and response regulator
MGVWLPGILPAAAIMMLTSGGFRGDSDRCRSLGVASYLLKPVRRAELLSALLTAMGDTAKEKEKEKIGGSAKPANQYAAQTASQQERASHEGLRVLLVEDNAVNQTVATGLLRKMGHSVVTADDGREALDILAEGVFDLVLMDVQMPVMDGLSATRRIREDEKRTQSRIPIIALTAHAMKGDRERCLAAGMDGYVSKPIDQRALSEAIASAVQASPVSEVRSTKATEESVPGKTMVWDAAKTLEIFGGDETIFRTVIEQYLKSIPKQMASLRQAVTQSNGQALTQTAHSLKGELGYLGIPLLSDQLRELEAMGRAGDLTLAPQTLAQLETTISAVMASIRDVNLAEEEVLTKA